MISDMMLAELVDAVGNEFDVGADQENDDQWRRLEAMLRASADF